MIIGTRSILFGVHQFAIHPWFVAWAWWRLYGFPWDPRLWMAFFVHDLGYWGKPNMDGEEGERHPELGAKVMSFFDSDSRNPFGDSYRQRDGSEITGSWADFCLYHSRFLAKRAGMPFSRLCVADKLAIALTPSWFYLPLAQLTGELKEYMQGKGARTPADCRSPRVWYRDIQRYSKQWALAHIDGQRDTWTGTVRDAAYEAEE